MDEVIVAKLDQLIEMVAGLKAEKPECPECHKPGIHARRCSKRRDTQETEEEPMCLCKLTHDGIRQPWEFHTKKECGDYRPSKPQDEPKEAPFSFCTLQECTHAHIFNGTPSSCDKSCHQESETELDREIKKAEEALGNERNLDQVTFYEGYIKGLRFLKSLEK